MVKELSNEEVLKQLAEKYESIKNLVEEYNNLSDAYKIESSVGCIISGDDSNDYDYSYDYEGWMPSSIGC